MAPAHLLCSWCGFALVVVVSTDFLHTQRYAAKRSDYYLKRAKHVKDGHLCSRLLEAAIDISPENKTVRDIAAKIGCGLVAEPLGDSSFQVGPIPSWSPSGRLAPSQCPVPKASKVKDIFPTPVGFVHASDLGMTDWKKTMGHLRDVSIAKFEKLKKAAKGEMKQFIHVNNNFFKSQITIPEQAMQETKSWPEMYKSVEYKNWAKAAKNVCVSYARKMNIPLSEHEEKHLNLVLWAAVYPEEEKKKKGKDDVITHYFHAHQESIMSFVLFAAMPEPTTPLTLADPRGLPPVEDFEFVQSLGDLGVDGEPPFHRGLEFFAGVGDVIIFPSSLIHKVPPHIGKGTRVVWPCNCELPKRDVAGGGSEVSSENPFDGWQRTSYWPALGLPGHTGARADAVPAYLAHADEIYKTILDATDPYMKLWEVQNQVLAMLQMAPHDPKVWIEAANVTAYGAVVLSARGEGDYFADAAAFLARAWNMDKSVMPSVKKVCSDYASAKNVPKVLKAGYKESKKLGEYTKKFHKQKSEFIQFLHKDINGPDKCKRMCPKTAAPPSPGMILAGMFSTRVVVATIAPGPTKEQDILAVAEEFLEGAKGAIKMRNRFDCWWRDPEASVTGVLCSGAATIWFADPRGAWPEKWPGSVPSGSASWPALVDGSCPDISTASPQDLLGTQPKAPFHRHTEFQCKSGEAVLFPAWLPHRAAPGSEAEIAPFTINVVTGKASTAGWRLPLVRPNCVAAAGDEAIQTQEEDKVEL